MKTEIEWHKVTEQLPEPETKLLILGDYSFINKDLNKGIYVPDIGYYATTPNGTGFYRDNSTVLNNHIVYWAYFPKIPAYEKI
jgi:hypothetical protein